MAEEIEKETNRPWPESNPRTSSLDIWIYSTEKNGMKKPFSILKGRYLNSPNIVRLDLFFPNKMRTTTFYLKKVGGPVVSSVYFILNIHY